MTGKWLLILWTLHTGPTIPEAYATLEDCKVAQRAIAANAEEDDGNMLSSTCVPDADWLREHP